MVPICFFLSVFLSSSFFLGGGGGVGRAGQGRRERGKGLLYLIKCIHNKVFSFRVHED